MSKCETSNIETPGADAALAVSTFEVSMFEFAPGYPTFTKLPGSSHLASVNSLAASTRT